MEPDTEERYDCGAAEVSTFPFPKREEARVGELEQSFQESVEKSLRYGD